MAISYLLLCPECPLVKPQDVENTPGGEPPKRAKPKNNQNNNISYGSFLFVAVSRMGETTPGGETPKGVQP